MIQQITIYDRKYVYAKLVLTTCLILTILYNLPGQNSVYDISLKKDGYLLGGTLGLEAACIVIQSKIKPVTLDEVNHLNPNKLWSFDRKAIGINSKNAASASDLISYGALILPFSLFWSDIERSDKKAVSVMAIETVLIADALTRLVKVAVQRKRPYVYDPDIDLASKTTGESKSSFPSGHTSKTAAMTFFTAKVLDDLFPDTKYRTIYWAGAIAIPAFTGYLRVRGSKHFPTDVFAGYALGASIGYLIPKIHKSKKINIDISTNGGLAINYKLY